MLTHVMAARVRGVFCFAATRLEDIVNIYLMNRLPSPMPPSPGPGAELCTEEEVAGLVHAFYARIRRDEVLGPIFEAHINDWDHHLAKLVDFWSSILRRTGRFSGAPMPKHAALPDLSAQLFQRWLMLFRENAAAQPNQAMAHQANVMAERIAQSLWMGYQINRDADHVPAALGHG